MTEVTFRSGPELSVTIGDTTTSEIVRGKLDGNAVSWENANVVRSHLAGEVAENCMSILQLNPEHGIWKRVDNLAIDRDRIRVLSTRSLFHDRTRNRSSSANWLTIGWLLWQKLVLL